MNVSKLHKYDVFLSYAHQDRDLVADMKRLLEHKGFVSYFPDEDKRQRNRPAKIFDAMFDSFVCLLVMASDKHAPWWDERIPDAIRERVATSRGEFRVLSVLLDAQSHKYAGNLNLPFVTEDLVVGEDSLNDEDTLHELILLIRGARRQPKSFADPALRAWAKSH